MTDNSQIFPSGFPPRTGPTITEQVVHDGVTEAYVINLAEGTWATQSTTYFTRYGTCKRPEHYRYRGRPLADTGAANL